MLPEDAYSILFVPLTKGKFAVIDQVDWPLIASHSWNYHTKPGRDTGYAETSGSGAARRHLRMHRVIAGVVDPGILVDHIDGNGLNNRRNNLRSCSHQKNLWNQRARRRNITGFKGVTVRPKSSLPYAVLIRVNGRSIVFGSFADAESAARRADEIYRKYRGPLARLNFPNPGEQSARRDTL